ncbi:serine hydrolase [Deinococcus sonorensis]|uniref:Serine hydrolase n=2 Tax=Deinococcus sonorensis TaxID=309891 RepID=A0AAU7UDP0_9DEIO
MTPPSLGQTLAAHGYAGSAALVILDAHTGEPLHAEQPERVFPAASTIKVPLLVLALQEAQAGRLDLNERLTLQPDDRVPGSGVLHELGGGLQPSVLDLLTLMTVVSDNTATNLMIRRLGLEAVQRWLARTMPASRLVGPLQLPAHLRNEAQRRGERNRTTAAEQTRLLVQLQRGELLDDAHTRLALDILFRQQQRDLLARHAPRDAAGELIYRMATKSGELNGVHHDVGLLQLPRPLAVALLSEGGSDPREHPDNRDVQLLAAAVWPLLQYYGFHPVASRLGDILTEASAVQ